MTSNVTQCTDVKLHERTTPFVWASKVNLLSSVTEGFHFFAHFDAASGYTDGRRLCDVTQFLPGAEEAHLQLVGVEK